MKQLYEYLVSLAMLLLLLVGLGGIAIAAFRNHGWIGTGMTDTWSFGSAHPMPAILLVLAAGLVLRAGYARHLGNGRAGKLPTVIVYAVMATGAYFIGAFAWQHGV